MSEESVNDQRYPGFVIINTAKAKFKDGDSLDGVIMKHSQKDYSLKVYESREEHADAMSALLARAQSKMEKGDSSSSSETSIPDIITSQPKPSSKKRNVTQETLKTVFQYEHSTKYKIIPQEGIPLIDYSGKVKEKFDLTVSGGNKKDIALDAAFRAQIEDYPDAPCDCACPFVINNILRDEAKVSNKHWKAHFEKQYIVILILSILFVLDDFGEGKTLIWYDVMIACFLGVPYVVMNTLLIFAEYSCMCKTPTIYFCCHPNGFGNCCGLTCKNCDLCNVDNPEWNCTSCEILDCRLCCCKRQCMCLIVLGCLCCKCPCPEYFCHKCCPKKCCCGKDGNCLCRYVCTKAKLSSNKRLIFNIFLYIFVPLVAASFAGVCAVFLDEKLENQVPRFIYWMLEVLTFPLVLFITETLLHFLLRKFFVLFPEAKKKESKKDDQDEL